MVYGVDCMQVRFTGWSLSKWSISERKTMYLLYSCLFEIVWNLINVCKSCRSETSM